MRFWKAFAWFAFGWALVVLRGAGIVVKKKPAKGAKPEAGGEEVAQRGPTWRRVSTTRPAASVKESKGSKLD